MLGEDCSHTGEFMFNVEGAINDGYAATFPILVSRIKTFILLFIVLPETPPPTPHKFLFPRAILFNFVINMNSTTFIT